LFLENSCKSLWEKHDLPWLCDSFKLAVVHCFENRVEGEGFFVSQILTLWVCSVELPEAKAAGKIGKERGSFPTRSPPYWKVCLCFTTTLKSLVKFQQSWQACQSFLLQKEPRAT
jgi:hypothetical protein